MPYKMPFKSLLNPGHTACAGCGEILALRHVLDAAGQNTIIAGATGCSEVTTSKYPTSSFKVPWIHANFENASAVASGILSALKSKNGGSVNQLIGESVNQVDQESTPINPDQLPSIPKFSAATPPKISRIPDDNVIGTSISFHQLPNVIAWGGDGATFDIGLGLISGSWERRENILYVCFDNEAYMNTGVQASGSTPVAANTTTSEPGKNSFGNALQKKDMVRIALAHDCVYVATATVGNVLDIEAKVKKALTLTGPKYLQILVTCVPGWYTDSKDTIKVARLAQQTGIYPVVEYVDGKLDNVQKCPKPRPTVEEYLKLQGRFKHLFKDERGAAEIKKIQEKAEENVRKYNLQ